MAGPGTAWGFWKTVQTVSPRAIEDEVALGFKIAIVGTPENRAVLRQALLTSRVTEIEREDAENHLREFDSPPDPDTGGAFAFTLYTAGPDEPVGVRGRNGVPLSGSPEEIVRGMLTLRPDLMLALARRLPLFRVPACNRMIQETSRVNASLALISALPGVLPVTAPFLPVTSVADIFLLTKNQALLIMRLAAAHGQKPAYTKQIKELIGTVGSALGWRTAARELVGLVPAGVGAAVKASIAYSGTVALGKAALWYYQSGGRKPTSEEIRNAYAESEGEAKQVVKELQKP